MIQYQKGVNKTHQTARQFYYYFILSIFTIERISDLNIQKNTFFSAKNQSVLKCQSISQKHLNSF